MGLKQKTKVEIINETVEFYSNNERAISDIGTCMYKTPNGLRCAHSRCISDEYIDKISKLFNHSTTADGVIHHFNDDIHLIPYRGNHPNFWIDIQLLHDTCYYWEKNKNGKNTLTKDGKKFVKELIKKWGMLNRELELKTKKTFGYQPDF